MLSLIERLFRYDDWANREVVTALKKSSELPPRSLKITAHILSAERLWLERIRSEKQTYPVWPDFTLEQCQQEVEHLAQLWAAHLSSLHEEDLGRRLDYKNTKGETWSSQHLDILMHVVLHSAYHRGQIATDMRAAGFTPAYTDFIHAARQEFVE
ncbi:MAG TPA: DinB family protein [Terriglobales bacterium]|nr:DinB family protein [Terriglobales bacterium]